MNKHCFRLIFSKSRKITQTTAVKYIKNNGLTAAGKQRLSKHESASIRGGDSGHWAEPTPAKRRKTDRVEDVPGQRKPNTGGKRNLADEGMVAGGKAGSSGSEVTQITDSQIKEWANFSQDQRDEMGGVTGFARSRNIDVTNARNYLRVSGVSSKGNARLSKSSKVASISNDQIKEWDGLSSAQRKAMGGVEGFAQSRNIDINSARNFLISTGLSFRGSQRLSVVKAAAVTDEHLKEWAGFSQQQRKDIGGVRGFAASRNINVSSAEVYLRKNGLSAKGEARLSIDKTSILQSGNKH